METVDWPVVAFHLLRSHPWVHTTMAPGDVLNMGLLSLLSHEEEVPWFFSSLA